MPLAGAGISGIGIARAGPNGTQPGEAREQTGSISVASDIPRILPTVIVGDDAPLLAQLATAFARKRSYLPLFDGPRLMRPDADHEVIRRSNGVALLHPDRVLLAGLPDATCALLEAHWPAALARRVQSLADVEGVADAARRRSTLEWGNNRLGLRSAPVSRRDRDRDRRRESTGESCRG